MPYYMYCTSCSLVVAHECVTCLVRFMSMLLHPWQRDPYLRSLRISSASRSVSVSSQYVLCSLRISSASSLSASLLADASQPAKGCPYSRPILYSSNKGNQLSQPLLVHYKLRNIVQHTLYNYSEYSDLRRNWGTLQENRFSHAQ